MSVNRSELPAYGPDNPLPLYKVKTELIWEQKYDDCWNRREVHEAGPDMPLVKGFPNEH